MPEAKPYAIPKQLVWDAYQQVKANRGAAGVDGESIEAFETDLKGNLYKIWNRMSSGSYYPPPVRLVEIPKATGGTRPLGIPTVADRVAQTVVKMVLEPLVEPHFHPDSYGYRPGRSALDAVGTARKRCWRTDWVIDLDIKGFFDSCRVTWSSGPWPITRTSPGCCCISSGGCAPPSSIRTAAGRSGRRAHRKGASSRPFGESLPALRVRSLDGAGLPGHPVRALCGRCAHPLPERGGGAACAGGGPGSSGGVRSGASSHEDPDRVLQGRRPAGAA